MRFRSRELTRYSAPITEYTHTTISATTRKMGVAQQIRIRIAVAVSVHSSKNSMHTAIS